MTNSSNTDRDARNNDNRGYTEGAKNRRNTRANRRRAAAADRATTRDAR